MTKIPAGRIAFFISPEDNEIHYSIVKVVGRYADNFEVLELPRGEADDFYVNRTLSPDDANYRIVVESSKEKNALEKLGIDVPQGANPLEILQANGYVFERSEALAEAGARELKEEHGFDENAHSNMVKQLITMRPFPVASNYGAKEEYRDFLQIEGDISQINLQKTHKIEKKNQKRLGAEYVEEGSWATLREIRQNIADFTQLASTATGADAERFAGELNYQKSIADWLETAEASLVGILQGQRVKVDTSSVVNPLSAMRATGAKAGQVADIFR